MHRSVCRFHALGPFSRYVYAIFAFYSPRNFLKTGSQKFIYRIFGNEKKVQQDEQDHVDVMHSAVFLWTN